jgi:DNA-binding transcriptional regulator/RsmH inhibitor MraZ
MAKWRIEIPAKYSIVIEEDDDGMVMKRAQAETTLVRRMGEMRQTNDYHNTATVLPLFLPLVISPHCRIPSVML